MRQHTHVHSAGLISATTTPWIGSESFVASTFELRFATRRRRQRRRHSRRTRTRTRTIRASIYRSDEYLATGKSAVTATHRTRAVGDEARPKRLARATFAAAADATRRGASARPFLLRLLLPSPLLRATRPISHGACHDVASLIINKYPASGSARVHCCENALVALVTHARYHVRHCVALTAETTPTCFRAVSSHEGVKARRNIAVNTHSARHTMWLSILPAIWLGRRPRVQTRYRARLSTAGTKPRALAPSRAEATTATRVGRIYWQVDIGVYRSAISGRACVFCNGGNFRKFFRDIPWDPPIFFAIFAIWKVVLAVWHTYSFFSSKCV